MKKIILMLMMVFMATAFGRNLAQTNGEIIKITIKNQLPISVRFYINGTFIYEVGSKSYHTAQIKMKSGPIR
ncbi:MAG: hypothetical protein ACYDH3_08975, partial [Candidatus Aminicenantales bacterium]